MGRAALAGCAALAAGCQEGPAARVEAPADSAAGEVSFVRAGTGGAALVVPVYINGEGPFDFALDTGATLTCLDHALAERLRLPERRGVSGVVAGAAGAGRIGVVEVDSVRVGSARVEELTACVLDLGHARQVGVGIDGLLGLNFLKPFRVTLDFQRDVLLLQDPATLDR